MNSDDLDNVLARLPVHDEDSSPAEHTRRACHAALAGRRRKSGRAFGPAAGAGHEASAVAPPLDWLEPAAALALSGVYLASAVALSVTCFKMFS